MIIFTEIPVLYKVHITLYLMIYVIISRYRFLKELRTVFFLCRFYYSYHLCTQRVEFIEIFQLLSGYSIT